jgi:hypothetical protein
VTLCFYYELFFKLRGAVLRSNKENRHALIDFKTLNNANDQVKKIVSRQKLTEHEEKIWLSIQEVLLEVKKLNIVSCDLPTDDAQNAALVLLAQQEVYRIFGNKDYDEDLDGLEEKEDKCINPKRSVLDKILNASKKIQNYKGGNCQEKAYVGFDFLIKDFIKKNLVTATRAIPLSLEYFLDHFVVLVNNRFVVDPWLNFAFAYGQNQAEIYQVFENSTLKSFFSIDANWQCSEAIETRKNGYLTYDEQSTFSTYQFFNEFKKDISILRRESESVFASSLTIFSPQTPDSKSEFEELGHTTYSVSNDIYLTNDAYAIVNDENVDLSFSADLSTATSTSTESDNTITSESNDESTSTYEYGAMNGNRRNSNRRNFSPY